RPRPRRPPAARGARRSRHCRPPGRPRNRAAPVTAPVPEPDPALVAAGSGAAGALLGAAATGPPTAPVDGLPVVAGPPVGARSGRYAGIEVGRVTLADGREVAYHRRRFL